MEKLEALEQLQSHIEGWEVCLGQEEPSGLGTGLGGAQLGFRLWSGPPIWPVAYFVWPPWCLPKNKKSLIIFQLGPHKSLDLKFLLKNW